MAKKKKLSQMEAVDLIVKERRAGNMQPLAFKLAKGVNPTEVDRLVSQMTGFSGQTIVKSSSAEADAQQLAMTGEASRDYDGMSLGARAQSNNSGAVSPSFTSEHDATDINAIKALQKEYDQATDPLSKAGFGK